MEEGKRISPMPGFGCYDAFSAKGGMEECEIGDPGLPGVFRDEEIVC